MSPVKPGAGLIIKRALFTWCIIVGMMTVLSIFAPTWLVILYTLAAIGFVVSAPHRRWLLTGSARKQLPRGY